VNEEKAKGKNVVGCLRHRLFWEYLHFLNDHQFLIVQGEEQNMVVYDS
jgi:hypothetical protein